tara:strand:- start:633 stop:740 length:108 start_codon:yes stop_codon:yes gene_type:complete
LEAVVVVELEMVVVEVVVRLDKFHVFQLMVVHLIQ